MPKDRKARTASDPVNPSVLGIRTDDNITQLAATLSPSTADADTRTVDILFFTGPDIPRYDYGRGEPYIMRFRMDGGDLSLLNSGAPVFDNHDNWNGAESQKGVVEKAWRDEEGYKATIRFSRRQEVEGLWQDIFDGIVNKFSMGVNILSKKELVQEKGKVRVVEVLKWQPYEISTAPLPADNATKTLAAEELPGEDVNKRAPSPQEKETMKPTENMGGEALDNGVETNPKPAAPTTPVAAVINDEQLNNALNVGQTKERARVNAITETCAALQLPASFGVRFIKDGTDIESFRRQAIEEKSRRSAQFPELRSVHADILQDETVTRRAAMTGALLNRFEPGNWAYSDVDRDFLYVREGKQRMFDASRQFSACSLMDIAKECLSFQNIHWKNRSRSEIVSLAFQSTSDFPYILADVANKTLRAGYEMTPSQWRLISARRTTPDFKTNRELILDSNSRLEKVNESGEFKRGKLIEGRETWSISTYGKIIAITRQAVINDDLNAFTRTPMLMGQEVAMLEADTVFDIITTNGILSDGNALFSSAHSNHVDNGAAISIDEMGTMRVLMMTQTTPGGKPHNISPRYLLVPAALSQLADQYTSSAYQATQASAINPMAGRLVPIVESRLDAVSSKAWYFFADPNTPNGTVLVHAYLEGQEGPYTETRNGFDMDGVEIKIRHDFGAAAIDHRGAVKNDGE